MPNHVTNEVIFHDLSYTEMDEIIRHTVRNGKVDFSILLPIPLNAWRGSASTEHINTFNLTSLDWRLENWGTKWNAYNHQLPLTLKNRLRFVFDTAWRPPYGWLAALLNKFNLPFDHNWLDEGSDTGRVGRFIPSKEGDWNTPAWTETNAEGEMQKHLHKLRWGVETPEELP